MPNCLLLLTLGATGMAAQAQIKTDASLGHAAQTLTGPSYLISQSLGKVSGNNLFQSFQTFNLATGETATFTTDSANIANVISRVTGGAASQINGLIQLVPAAGAPGFYFINPAGVVFGAGAAIDVPGAFHVSTADYIKFPDGQFHADLSKASTFSSAAPEAFGFLGTQRASITLQDGAVLSPSPLQPISLVAGDIGIDNGVIGASGDVRLVAVGPQPAEIGLSGALPAVSGDLAITNSGLVASANSGANNGGQITAAAGNILLDGEASLYSFTKENTTGNGGAINVMASGFLQISNGANLYSTTASAGNAGAINVNAQNISIAQSSFIQADTEPGSTGRSSDIRLTATQGVALTEGSSVAVNTWGEGHGGALEIRGDTILVSGNSSISTGVAGSGDGGAITLNASSGLFFLDHGYALAATIDQGSGAVGSVSVATKNMVIDGDQSGISSNAVGFGVHGGDVSVAATGDVSMTDYAAISTVGLEGGMAGNIQLSANDLSLDGGAHLASVALSGLGAAGNMTITALGKVSLSNGATLSANTFTPGDGGTILLRAHDLSMSGGSAIGSAAFDSTGNAGLIDIGVVGGVDVSGGSAISSASNAMGRGGTLRISAADIKLSGAAFIFTSSSAAESGPAGNIVLNASGKLSITEGADIDSSTYSLTGNAGDIAITAGSVSMDRGFVTSLAALSEGTGQAGTIAIQTPGALAMANGSLVSTSTLSQGNAGSISLQAGNLTMDGNSQVGSLALSGSHGDAGSIVVSATQGIKLTDGGTLGTATSSFGRAGSTALSAADILMDGANSGVTAAAGVGSSGQTGNVSVTATHSLTLSNGASLAVTNDAVVSNPGLVVPTAVTATAADILLDGALITSASSGNVDASNVVINAADSLTLIHSGVVTAANTGNGGSISIQGGHLMQMSDTQITTSVFGSTGNGGNIDVSADALVMNTGFIQANTAAADGNGGKVNINVDTLVASGNTLFVGGQTPLAFRPGVFGYNVIQAAAPTGLSGVIDISSPVLDLSGSLHVLTAQLLDSGGLGRTPCQITGGSSLAPVGRGGLPRSGQGLMRAARGGAQAPHQASAGGPVPVELLALRDCR